eukprot:CAMPEP_0180417316 /NCGR_PEP_ID=MMETSP1036_2-20121128/966_1 /TAXON_ID=632150 /ORGANISM="Azadinium spinosum, Strain 3D9" /LENGTH=299 /DNA_ID=CAMNT_0022422333 /DNA_START=21 /DNA_END=917 /DNA_ORIENTATION=+
MIFYFFAVGGVQIIGRDRQIIGRDRHLIDLDNEVSQLVENKFGTIGRTLLTLLQFATLDSWTAVVQPIVFEKPALMLYFLSFIVVAAITLTNLVTAVIVQNSIEASENDKMAKGLYLADKRRAVKEKLQTIFSDMDADASQSLSRSEVWEAYRDEKLVQDSLAVLLSGAVGGATEQDINDLFTELDFDNDDQLSVMEFLDGICAFQEDKVTFFLMCMHRQIQQIISEGRALRSGLTSPSRSPTRRGSKPSLLGDAGRETPVQAEQERPRPPPEPPPATPSAAAASALLGGLRQEVEAWQ